MEFAAGRPLRLPPPPPMLAVPGVRLRCIERPEVIQGQAVRPGQVLLRPTQTGSWFQVSPLAGTVRSVEPAYRLEGHLAPGADPRGYEVVIEAASPTSATSLEVAAPRGRRLDAWFVALRQIGSWSDRDGGVGFIAQLAAAQTQPVDTVICVGLDAFPPYPDASSLLLSFPDDAVLGTIIVSDLVSAANSMLLAPDTRSVQSTLSASCRNYNLKLGVSPNRYPAADPMLVAWTHAGKRRLPRGVNPATRGMLLLHPWTAIRIGRWFTLQRFDLVRPIFVAWPGGRPALSASYAMPGQPLRSLDARLPAQLDSDPRRVLLGNPMTGRPVSSAGVHVAVASAPGMAPTTASGAGDGTSAEPARPAAPGSPSLTAAAPAATPRPQAPSRPDSPTTDLATSDLTAPDAPSDESPSTPGAPSPTVPTSPTADPPNASPPLDEPSAPVDLAQTLAPCAAEPTVPDDELLVCIVPREPAPQAEACVTCGWCVEVCPTSLRPVYLADLATSRTDDDALLDHLDWCMDCGLCTHVCPSSIPLAQTLRQAAHELADRRPGRFSPTVPLPVKSLNAVLAPAAPASNLDQATTRTETPTSSTPPKPE